LLCAIGQLLMDLTKPQIKPGHILVGYVVGGCILSAAGLYQFLVDLGGAGATVPLSGFGHLMAQGVIEAVKTKGFLGVFTGGVESAAGGITAAVVFGYLITLLFNPKG
ncbi:MAG: SpoVA/SpoVAEb family sporulation membrane protein, partial [Chitinophagales bacterium]